MRAQSLLTFLPLLLLTACDGGGPSPGGPGPDASPGPGPGMTTDGSSSPGDGGDMGSPTCTIAEIPAACAKYLSDARAAHQKVLEAWPPQQKGLPAVDYFNQVEGSGWDVTVAFALWKCLEQQAPQCLPGCKSIRDQQLPVAAQVYASRKATLSGGMFTEPLDLLVRYWSIGQGLACLPGASGMAKTVLPPEVVESLIQEVRQSGVKSVTEVKNDGSIVMKIVTLPAATAAAQ